MHKIRKRGESMATHKKEDVINKIKSSEKHNLTNTDETMVCSVEHLGKEMDTHLKASKIEKSGNWVLYKEKWLENEKGGSANFYKYGRGDVIRSFNFGVVNMGTEIRYPHPCVVIYDNNEDWLIVAPITSAKIGEDGQPIVHEFEVFADRQRRGVQDSNEFFFTKKSVIQVDQICRVSKSRALIKTRKKLREELLNQVDNMILEKYIPKKHGLLEQLKSQLNKAEDENITLAENVDALKQEVAQLKKQLEKFSENTIDNN